jgi:hypothetical protein
MIKISLSVFLLFFSIGPARSQTFGTPPPEEQSESNWRITLDVTNFKFTLPDNYGVVKMEYCNYGTWICKARHKTFFNRVIMKADSSVIIGVQILSNKMMQRNQFGQIVGKQVNWIENAKIVFRNRMDTSPGSMDIDKALLKKNWDAVYGEEFNKGKCDGPYLGKKNNKHLLIANEDTQILIVYFYSDEFKDKIDSEVKKTIGLLLKK